MSKYNLKIFINIKLKNNKNVCEIEKLNLIFELFISNAKNNFLFVVFANSNAIINVTNIDFDKMFNIYETF